MRRGGLAAHEWYASSQKKRQQNEHGMRVEWESVTAFRYDKTNMRRRNCIPAARLRPALRGPGALGWSAGTQEPRTPRAVDAIGGMTRKRERGEGARA